MSRATGRATGRTTGRGLILAIDDDPLVLMSLQSVLASRYRLIGVATSGRAERVLQQNPVDVVLLDLNLSKKDAVDGLELLKSWKQKYPRVSYLCCSGDVHLERALDGYRNGSVDFIAKPFSSTDLLRRIAQCTNRQVMLNTRKSSAKSEPTTHPIPRYPDLVGDSKVMVELKHKIAELQGHHHLNVLILGESGTGKELVARYLNLQEKNRPFVVANMPAIPQALMESELFGVAKGAFTGAYESRAGKFELADGGDIFLDEIAEVPLLVQAKLLRVLQEKYVERIGSSRTIQLRFRAIAATNQNLSEWVIKGFFRSDLFYRLTDVVLMVPTLRERKSDIPKLVDFFLRRAHSATPPSLSSHVLAKLMNFDWPGNVRQLESTMRRALTFNKGATIDSIDIVDPFGMCSPLTYEVEDSKTKSRLQTAQRTVMEQTFQKNLGDRSKTIRELGISKATFYRKINEFGIPLRDSR